jgi:hypothetical protein
MEHSPTSATGTAWERTPWHATQRAARDIVSKVQSFDSWLDVCVLDQYGRRRVRIRGVRNASTSDMTALRNHRE